MRMGAETVKKTRERPPRKGPITVNVVEHDGPPMDVEGLVRLAVRIAMRAEGITPGVAAAPVAQVGSGR